MNTVALPSAAALLTQARQCDCLLDVLRSELNSDDELPRGAELIGIADDLAAVLYRAFWDTPCGGSSAFKPEAVLDLSGAVGRLWAATSSMRATASQALALPECEQRSHLHCQLGWMQALASDVATGFVQQMQEAIDADEPPRPRVEVGARDSSAGASQVARLVSSSMDRDGSSLAAAACG